MSCTLILATAALMSACAGAGPRAPEAPPRPVDPETRVVPERQRPPPRLIAPPPAYGNKVVMAQGEAATSVN